MSAGPVASPSRRVVFVLVAVLLALPLFFGSPRKRIYDSLARTGSPQAVQQLDPVENVVSIAKDDFQHTGFYHVSLDESHDAQCDLITYDLIQTAIAANKPPTEPRAFHVLDGKLLKDLPLPKKVGTSFCLLFVVPQSPPATGRRFTPTPIEGAGPDAIVASLESPDVKFVFTDHPIFWGISNTAGIDYAVYAAPYTLNQPGVYELSAIAELRNYEWGMEDPIKLVFKTVEDVQNAKDLEVTSGNVTITAKPAAVTIIGAPASRPTQPCFRDGFDDLRGRWYRKGAFSTFGNQTALNDGALVDFANKEALVDELGWTFAPDKCSLTIFSAEDHMSCFEDRNVQFLGDSNLRRLIKAFTSGGDKWCITNVEDNLCQCKDGDQTEMLDANNKWLNASRYGAPFYLRDTPVTWGRNGRVFLDFIGGLVNPAWGNPHEMYFNGSETDPELAKANPGLNLIRQRQIQYGSIDVVVLSLVVWDLAAVITPAETLAALPEFRQELFAAYPESTRFVMRLSNSVCCGLWGSKQRFSSPRFEMWNALFREFWRNDYESGKLMFYDASELSNRADMAAAIPCGVPHLPCSHVRIEDQIFMNTVCERSTGSSATIRDWAERRRRHA